MRLSGKKGIVVGASRGIGRAIASGLATEGAHVACAGRSLAAVTATVESLRADDLNAFGVELDLMSRESVHAGVSDALDGLGRIDFLVQSGGVTATTSFVDISFEEWRRVLGTNLDGTFLVGQAVAGQMLRQGGGSIVVVTSQLADAAIRGKAHYIASKGALSSLVKAMTVELAPKVRVNALAPGVTRTDMAMDRLGRDDAALRWTESRIPLGRLAEPSEMTAAAAFLVSDDSSYVTGSTLLVDGGYLAM